VCLVIRLNSNICSGEVTGHRVMMRQHAPREPALGVGLTG
jgi:hypothetical protein